MIWWPLIVLFTDSTFCCIQNSLSTAHQCYHLLRTFFRRRWMQVGGISVKPPQICRINSPHGPFQTAIMFCQIWQIRIFRRQLDFRYQLIWTFARIHPLQSVRQNIFKSTSKIPQCPLNFFSTRNNPCVPRQKELGRIRHKYI